MGHSTRSRNGSMTERAELAAAMQGRKAGGRQAAGALNLIRVTITRQLVDNTGNLSVPRLSHVHITEF